MKKDIVSNRTLDVYKKIFAISSATLIIILQTFIFILTSGVDIVEFKFVDNPALKITLQFLTQIAFFGLIGVLVFSIVSVLTKILWKKIHSEINYEGTWLHIHEKNPIRIGIVEISQNYYDLNVRDAVNIGLNVDSDKLYEEKTTWRYNTAIIDPEGKEGLKIIACYSAHKKGSGITNHGVHLFDDDECSNGEPFCLKGLFSDAFLVNNTEIDFSQKKGKIYLIKISPRIRQYIYESGNINYNKLSNILNEKALEDEFFVRKLRTIVNSSSMKENK